MTDNATVLQVRAHTALCMQGFVGRGYSDAFVAQMTQVLEQLKQGAHLELTTSPDSICGGCPNGTTGGCRLHERANESHIVQQDRAVLEKLQLPVHAHILWTDLVQRIRETITSADLDTLCGDCPWLPMGMCKLALDRLHRESDVDTV